MAGFADRRPDGAKHRRKVDLADAAGGGGAHRPRAGMQDRRRPRVTGAAAQSVIAALYDMGRPSDAERSRAAQAAMGDAPKMTQAQIDAELAKRAKAKAWVFERRRAASPRNLDVEDAIVID